MIHISWNVSIIISRPVVDAWLIISPDSAKMSSTIGTWPGVLSVTNSLVSRLLGGMVFWHWSVNITTATFFFWEIWSHLAKICTLKNNSLYIRYLSNGIIKYCETTYLTHHLKGLFLSFHFLTLAIERCSSTPHSPLRLMINGSGTLSTINISSNNFKGYSYRITGKFGGSLIWRFGEFNRWLPN